MKFTDEIIIHKSLGRVIELFDDPDNLAKWQPGFISFEPISGTPGQPGAKARLKYKMGKREVEMIETITVRNLPHEFSGTYEAKGVYNVVRNFFSPIDNHTTLYRCENEFRFTNFMMKVLGFLMPGAFKKQSRKYMELFKQFAEKEV